jgi:hypothetical protein
MLSEVVSGAVPSFCSALVPALAVLPLAALEPDPALHAARAATARTVGTASASRRLRRGVICMSGDAFSVVRRA